MNKDNNIASIKMEVKDECKIKVEEHCSRIKTKNENLKFYKHEELESKDVKQLVKYEFISKLDSKYIIKQTVDQPIECENISKLDSKYQENVKKTDDQLIKYESISKIDSKYQDNVKETVDQLIKYESISKIDSKYQDNIKQTVDQLIKYENISKLNSKYQDNIKEEDKRGSLLKEAKELSFYKEGGSNDFKSICKGEKVIIDTSESLIEISENVEEDLEIYSQRVQTPCFTKQKTKTKKISVTKSNEKTILKCAHCHYTTTTKNRLYRHMSTHGLSSESFTCSICDYHSARKDSLVEHTKKHSEKQRSETKKTCAHCNYSTTYKKTLVKHMSIHGFNDRYTCSHCKKTFVNRYNLIRHLSRKKRADSARPFVCSSCDEAYGTSFELKRHSLIHLRQFPYQCTYCDYATTRRYILQEHLKRHDKYKMKGSGNFLKTPKATDIFKSKSSNSNKEKVNGSSDMNNRDLKLRKIGLENKYPFECSTCGLRTSKRALLMYHILRKHTKEPVFKCNRCDYSTYTIELLQKHKRFENHDVFSCEHCQFTCFKYLMIQKHMKKHFC